MAGNLSDDDEPVAGINVTPLVDVVLVCLVALMVTATDLAAKGLGVELPSAATGADGEKSTLVIALDAGHLLYLDGARIDEAALRSAVRSAHDKSPDLRATVAADGRVPHAEVVKVMDLLREEHVSHFSLQVRKGG